jgi:hypothetical protein
MFALCGNRTRDLLRSRRAFPSLSHIGRQYFIIIIYDPTARAQAFLMDFIEVERAITHNADPVWVGGCYRLQMQSGATA